MTVHRPDNVDSEVFREAPTWESVPQKISGSGTFFLIFRIQGQMRMFLFQGSNIAISFIKCLNY